MSSTTYCNILLLLCVFCAKCSFAAVWRGEGDKSYRKKEMYFPSFGVLIKLTAVAEMAKCQGFSCKHFAEGTGGSHRCLCLGSSLLANKPHSVLLIYLTKIRPSAVSVTVWGQGFGVSLWVAITAHSLWQVSLKKAIQQHVQLMEATWHKLCSFCGILQRRFSRSKDLF